MTRDEAIKRVIEPDAGYDHQHAFVDSLVALGILKLDEPKSAREKFIARMKAYNYGDASCGMKDALGAFDYAVGLQTGTK